MAKKSKSPAMSNKGNESSSAAGSAQPAAASQDAVTMLTQDHRKVEQLFAQYEQQSSSEEKAQTAKEIAKELTIHTLLEEQIFYPACRDDSVDSELLNEAQVEHDGAKLLINELMSYDSRDEYIDAKVTVLSEYIRHHVAEEEKPQEGIFAKAKSAGVDLKELGQQLQTRKSELLQKAQAGALPSPPTRSFDLESNLTTQERDMERRYERDRDEEGRFTSERGSRGYSGYSRDQDDDYERGSSRGRGQGGWFGDSEGHSEASERGWEGRRGGSGSRGRNEDYDDERSSSRGRYSSSRGDDDDDRSSRGRSGQGGWFGDPEGHSEASRRGWEERGGGRGGGYSSRGGGGRDYDDDRSSSSRGGSRGGGHGGWFGDPEGHSRAAEEGWENRGGGRRSRSDDDDGGSRSSRGGSSGRGHGGWFGDPEGHSRASEEGWEHRSGGRSSRNR
jgi:hemerythrin superfamily protein